MSIHQEPIPRSARIPPARAPRPAGEAEDSLGLLLAPLQTDLATVEEIFERELASDLPGVNTLVRHIGRFRGKMLRPMLLLLLASVLLLRPHGLSPKVAH